jgi:hypothetical protein
MRRRQSVRRAAGRHAGTARLPRPRRRPAVQAPPSQQLSSRGDVLEPSLSQARTRQHAQESGGMRAASASHEGRDEDPAPRAPTQRPSAPTFPGLVLVRHGSARTSLASWCRSMEGRKAALQLWAVRAHLAAKGEKRRRRGVDAGPAPPVPHEGPASVCGAAASASVHSRRLYHAVAAQPSLQQQLHSSSQHRQCRPCETHTACGVQTQMPGAGLFALARRGVFLSA